MAKPDVLVESVHRKSTAFSLLQHKVKEVVIKSASPLTKFEIIPLQFPVSLMVAVFDR